METTIVREEIGRGTRGGPYIYVVEGNELVHIDEYAIKRGKHGNIIIYEVPKDKVAGKVIYCFDFSRSGGAFLRKCRIEDFEDGLPKRYEYLELIRNRAHEISDLRFRIKNPTLSSLLREFEQLFILMIYEIKEYQKIRNFEISFMGYEERLRDAFENFKAYYFTFMSLPKDRSRINSLKVTRRWIYQIWILKLICEVLQVSRFKVHEYEGRPYWWIEQGSDLSTAIGETPFGDLTFWIEFQPSRYAHMAGMFVGRRVPIRPDIVVAKGCFKWTEEFVNSKKPIDLIVECKENPFNEWKGEIQSQIIPYKEFFKPNNFIIASLELTPDVTKRMLENRGINVIDNLRPKSENIRIFSELIRKIYRR
jgi:hypothetical protein